MELLKINPAVIFALLAVVFAVLNIILWVIVWKKTENPDTDENRPEVSAEAKEGLKNKIDEVVGRNLRLEDQLWGILDKLKEQEQMFKELKKDIASVRPPDDANKHVTETMEMWSIKILKTVRECIDSIKNSDKDTGKPDGTEG